MIKRSHTLKEIFVDLSGAKPQLQTQRGGKLENTKRNHICTKKKKNLKNISAFYMQVDVSVGYNADDIISGESMRSEKAGTPADLVTENLRDHVVIRR